MINSIVEVVLIVAIILELAVPLLILTYLGSLKSKSHKKS